MFSRRCVCLHARTIVCNSIPAICMKQQRHVSIKVLSAPADGINPALLLTIGQGVLGVRWPMG